MSHPAQDLTDRKLAYLFTRIILGMNIFIHGLTRIQHGVQAFGHQLVPMFAQTPLPSSAVYLFSISLPWAELLVGALLLLGWQMRYVCSVGMLMIVALTFGSSLRQDWNAASMQLMYALFYGLLLTFRQYNVLSLDTIRTK